MSRDDRDAPLTAPGVPSELPRPVPVMFGPAERRLFGWYHAARPGSPRNRGVVLCNPAGYEALCTHASYRYLAERLAEAGFAALRFDYDGTGDSGGSDEDDGRVEHWVASVGHAVDMLRDRSRCAEICLFGVRLGATLAAVAAAERGDVSDLILWAPCRSGRSFLRELRVLRAAHGQGESSPPDGQAPEDGDDFESAGFVYTRATLDALDRLDAAALPVRPASHALLIARDDLPEDQRLSRNLVKLGTAVTQVPWPGYDAMMRDALDTTIPCEAVDSLVAWLEGLPTPDPSPPSAHARSRPEGTPSLAADTHTEEPMSWGDAPRMFGILTRPRTAGPRAGTAVVLLNIGAVHRVGTSRVYVTLARRLAAEGFLVLRLDLPGLGDSAEGDSPARDHISSPASVADVQAALSHLEEQTGADRFVLIGLCSGAYISYLTTCHDPRVVGQVLINSQTFTWTDEDSLEDAMRQSYRSTRFYLDALASMHTWRRILFQQVDSRGITKALGGRLRAHAALTLKSLLSVSLRRRPHETEVGRQFRMIAERGADTLLLFSAQDPGLETTLLSLGTNARKIQERKHLGLALIEGADHTFTQKTAREEMLSVIVRHLAERHPAAEE